MIFVMGIGNVQEEQLSFMTTWILSVTFLNTVHGETVCCSRRNLAWREYKTLKVLTSAIYSFHQK